MKFVALISGGKDSIYNIMCCQKAGHQLVCVANLYPPNKHECDSYMYQSVGAEGVECVGAALNVPIYRTTICGTPLDLTMDYRPQTNDEVEDLYGLLKEVLEKHPDVKGMCC